LRRAGLHEKLAVCGLDLANHDQMAPATWLQINAMLNFHVVS
jgi:hypothetical protein